MPVSRYEDFAWACGLFEGEGTVINRGRGRRRNRGLSLSTTDLDVIQRFQAIVGVGAVYSSGGTNKTLWRWTVSRWCDTEPLAKRMLPYMGQRRGEAIRDLLASAPTAHPNTRLTDAQVQEIRRRAAKGEAISGLATEFGIDRTYAGRLISGKRRAV